MGRRGDKITQRGIAATKDFERWTMNCKENLLNKLSRFCMLVLQGKEVIGKWGEEYFTILFLLW